MRLNNKTSLILTASLLLIPTFLFAAAPDSQGAAGNYNMALISLVSLMVILLFIIGMLANTMRQLSLVLRDKNRKAKKDAAAVVKAILLFLTFSFAATQVMAAEAVQKTTAPVSDVISGIPANDFYTIIAAILLELIVIFAQVMVIKTLLREITGKPELEARVKAIAQRSWFWDKFNAAAPLEKEKDVLLDHDYDGIQELDNSLPPWWKYGFYLTIVIGCIYFYRFHISHDGPSSHEEFVAAMKQAEEEKAAYLAHAANNVDENTVTLLSDPNDVAAGKEIFVKICAACHVADGGGNVGPNLTDDYWLHGGTIKDVFKSIKYGWQDKGMKSWKDDFSPKQIQQLASFVKSLKGSHPASPKAPQGELFIEAGQGGPKTDSTRIHPADTAKAGKVAVK